MAPQRPPRVAPDSTSSNAPQRSHWRTTLSKQQAVLGMSADRPVAEELGLIFGLQAIAAEIGQTRWKTYGLIKAGKLPTKKVRGELVGNRARIREAYASLFADITAAPVA